MLENTKSHLAVASIFLGGCKTTSISWDVVGVFLLLLEFVLESGSLRKHAKNHFETDGNN